MTKKELRRLLKRALWIYRQGFFTKDETVNICAKTIREYLE